MKKLLSLLAVVVLTAVSAQAQWVWESFENGVGNDTTYFPARRDAGFFTNGPTSYFNLKDTSDSYHGSGALKINYRVEAFDGWGGYVVRLHKNDLELLGDSAKYDLSSGKYLSFWIKVIKNPEKTQPGDVNLEFKLKEQPDIDTGEDLFLKNFGTILQEPPGTWRQYIVPLEHQTVNPDGFSTQFGNGDGEFQQWNVVGYEMAIVYITDGKNDDPPTAIGEFVMDKIQILDQRYMPVLTLDNQSDTTKDRSVKDAFWRLDDMSWDGNAGARKFIMSNEAVDTVEGEGALKIEYAVVGSQEWGGYVQVDHIFETPLDLSGNSTLGFYMKNVVPTELKNRTIMRVDLYDVKDNVYEGWTAVPNVSFDEAWDWDFIQVPLETTSKGWWELKPGDVGFNKNDGTNDGAFDLSAIGKIRFQVIVLRTAPEPFGPDVVSSGTFILDLFTPSGYRENDTQAPLAPTGLLGLPGEFKNLLIWEDVPDEEQERYRLYYSVGKPITSVEDEGVFVLNTNVAEGVQAAEHNMNAPISDREFDMYYAITATDKAGNTSEPGATASAVTNTAKGAPVVWFEAPSGFAADGNVGEWASIPGWELKTSDNSATIINPGTWPLDGDTDLWAKAWAAMDQTHLYLAMQVYDDFYYVDSTKDSYNQDAPDVSFGLYDYKGKDHTGYRRNATPDYHFRFNVHRASTDINGATVTHVNSPDYEWVQTTDGYIFEWKVSFEAIAALHEDEVFVPEDGMMISFDWLINDGDATSAREGGIRWSKSAEDNMWNNVASWNYTWIGTNSSTFYVSVDGNGQTATDFRLDQNYPNPFNPTTAVPFSMKQAGFVSLKVYDVLGKEVATLFAGNKPQGDYVVQFNGTGLTSGVYFVKMTAENFSSVRKMTLIK